MMMIFIVQKHTFYIMNWYFKDNQFQLVGNLLHFQICESPKFDRFLLSLFCVVVSVTVILMSLFLMLMLLLTYLFPFRNGMECQ